MPREQTTRSTSPTVTLALTIAVLAIPTNGAAQSCAHSNGAAFVTSCSDILNQASRLDQVRTINETQGRATARLNDTPWIAPVWQDAPVMVSPSDTFVSVHTSFQHLDAYKNKKRAAQFSELKPYLPENFQFPKRAPNAQPLVDVWSTVDVAGIGDETHQARRGGVGGDIKINRNTVIGVMAERGNTEFNTTESTAEDYQLATYFAARPMKGLLLDARAGMGETTKAVDDDVYWGTQQHVAATATGAWNIAGFAFTPSIGVTHGTEHLEADTTSLDKSKTSIVVDRRISRPINLDGGQKLEPFLNYKSEHGLDAQLDGAGTSADETQSQTYGAGLTLQEPDDYSLSVSSEMDERPDQEKPDFKSRLQFKMPLD